jgi:hypothetical protein
MSKTKAVTLENYLDGPSAEYEGNYKIWTNKAEWRIVGKVKDRIQQMYNARQGSCNFINYDGTKSWDRHWDLMEKDYLMWSEFDGSDDWESNLKSSISYRTTSFIDARERKQEISFLVEARNEDDERKGRAITYKYMLEDYLRRNTDIRYKFLDCSKRSKIFGTSIAYIPYTIRTREVMFPKDIDIKREDIEKGLIPEMEYEKKIIIDFEDIDFVPWDIRDFYIDPNAQYLHGTTHSAVDAAGITYLTPAQVKLMFQGDASIKNLDKIDNVGNTESYNSPFFKAPRDAEKGYGELIYYYNVETDSEVIIYEDVLLKNGPIPYIDKQIPFVAFHFIRHPGSFYGMSVGDVTIQASSEDSAIKNARLNRIKFATNPPTFIGATIFGDVDDQWDRMEPNMLIKVGDVSQVRPLELPNIPFDSFRISEELKDETIMNTGVNPQGMVLPMASTPATNTLNMKENMSDMVNMYTDNLMYGMVDWGKLLISRVTQFYSKPSKKKSLELNKKELRELRLEDIDLYKNEDGNYAAREIKGSRIIPLEKEMFKWTGEPRVYINPDFVSPISEAFKMRKAQEVLPQLITLAGDRSTPSKNGTYPVVDIRKLVRWYLKEMNMADEDLLIDEDEDKIEEIKQAMEQQEKMQNGDDVSGRAGEPLPHRYTHSIELRRLNDTMSSPEFMQMLQSGDPKMVQFVEAVDSYRKQLTEHLRLDNLLAVQAGEAAIADADAVTQSLQPQPPASMIPPGMSMGGGMPMPAGAEGLPNPMGGVAPMPNNMGQEDMTGQMAGGMMM